MTRQGGPSDQQEAEHLPAHTESPIGRTIADLLHEILINPRKGFSLFILFGSLILVTLTATWGFIKVLNIQPSEIRLGGTDPHILLQNIHSNGTGEYVIIVSPEGWQASAITVQPGDRIRFTAGGRISIDIGNVTDKVAKRWKSENEVADEMHIQRDDPKETRVPEDYFSPEQRKELILDRPWSGPDGFDYVTAFRGRMDRFLLHGNGERAGGLVAAVSSKEQTPSQADAFFVGEQSEVTAKQGGAIWFTVNDVQSKDPANPYLFYNDNIGSFWVKVVVKRESKFPWPFAG